MKTIGIFSIILIIIFPSITISDEGEKKIYHYRSNLMEASATHLKALQGYVKGELAIQKHIPAHVDALLMLNGMYQDLFPAGKQHPESEAMASIWSNPKDFTNAIQYNRHKIMALKQVDPGDIKNMKRAVNEVRMSCGDCHYYFRDR